MPPKRWLSLVLLLLILSACNIIKAPVQEPHTFTVLYNQKDDLPVRDDWLILDEYKKRKNVELDIWVGDDADFERAIIQTLESGNLPDIILKIYPGVIESYANNGVLLPFSDYENLMPYFTEYIATHNLQGELDKLRLANGKYYILPGYQREIQVQQWTYRRDLFEQYNLETPKTYDEIFEALAFLKSKNPSTTPLSASWGGAHLFAMMGPGYDIPAGWSGIRSYNSDADRWQFAPATQNYQELLRFLNRCYAAGILDPDIFTQSFDDYLQKIEDGRALVTVTWITSGFGIWNEKLHENGFPNGEWAALAVPESTLGIKALPPVDPFRKGLIVPARVLDEPYFEDLLRFLDWAIYSEEGMTLTTWGVEGLTYENTPTGKTFLADIQTPKNPQGSLDTTQAYGLATIFDLNENAEYEDYKKPAEIVTFLENSLNAAETAELSPPLILDSSTSEAASLIEENLVPYAAEAMLKFISGELSIDQDWDKYLLTLENSGYQTLEEIWNAAWQKQNNP